ncbi:carboxypeptidase-like regulatory domain-containing protein [Chitinophaga sp. sic0106]|uniref:carboxypeptidase-like regulatory domain-containing protein n=1 Tax=Chitinophaga sp. sic0106 TaxID=2854785 RepID=UPI001C483E4A|nr:carboxypeptidase-like regulatory domain-containing protein [Chitinophaga sp. sic0106]MBV7531949.1 carboxypeptidase-like regulatory domain-containing protein [Chitinophaga sp. sic0106]
MIKQIARILALGCMLMLTMQFVQAQVVVTGVVSDTNRLVLPYATVTNLTTGKHSVTDQGGFYRINASRGDRLSVTFVGYVSDTVLVTATSGSQTINIRMTVTSKFLKGVDISAKYSPYQLDSMARRDQYGYLLDLPNKPLAGGNTPEGAGIVFSPITRFSKKEKQKRQFKENYETMEKEKYIDSRYTPALVSRVTGLSGDSLQHFMRDNYPSYETMRSLENNDLLYWITDKYKNWIKK